MEDLLLLEVLNDPERLSDDDIDDAFVLHVLHEEERLGNRGALYGRFNFETLFDIEAKQLFRYHKNDIVRLVRLLNIPDVIQTESRVSVSGLDGLCILLRRLAYPNRLADLEPLFGLSAAALSSVINHMENLIYVNKGHLLQNLGNVPYLNQQKLIYFSDAITAKGSPVHNCWGFIDGTARPICRPSADQENYYSGHKKVHCVKYQSVLTPDGIIISLKGPFPGRRHDAGIFRASDFYAEMEEHTVFPNDNRHFVIYGDQAYGLRELLLRPYSENELIGHPERQMFNNSMRVLRVSVEWGFGKVLQEFAFVDFKKNQKLLLQDIGTMYTVAVLLTNCHTCLYGSETATYFAIVPPLLEEYLDANNN